MGLCSATSGLPTALLMVRHAHHERNLRTARPEPVEGRAGTFPTVSEGWGIERPVYAPAFRRGWSFANHGPELVRLADGTAHHVYLRRGIMSG